MTTRLAVVVLVALVASGARGQSPDPNDRLTAEFDQVLEVQVRDGLVYYRALKADRARLDRFVAALPGVSIAGWTRGQQLAFWINAYNALVLRTVIDRYPIATLTAAYPPNSIRQIPGAFESPHRVAGKSLTLEQIEQVELAGFQDPRVFLAIGRGTVGSGRLRSEAFTGENLERQLSEVAFECATRDECLRIDRAENRVQISEIFFWRQQEFVARYADLAAPVFASRSPLERAVLALVGPALYIAEEDLLMRNRFQVEFLPYDWSLNDRP